MSLAQKTGRTMVLNISDNGKTSEQNVLPVDEDISFTEYYLQYYGGSENGCLAWVSDENYTTQKYASSILERQIWLLIVDGGNCHGWTFRDTTPLDMKETHYHNISYGEGLASGCWGNPTCGSLKGYGYEPIKTGTSTHTVQLPHSGKHVGRMIVRG